MIRTSDFPSRAAPALSFWLLCDVARGETFSARHINDSVMSIFDSSDGIRLGPAITAGLAILVGLVVCFAGYRLFRPTMFVCGFLLGGILVSSALEWAFAEKEWLETALWVGFIVGGLLCGMTVVAVYNMGIFLVGVVAGVFLAYTLNTSFGYLLLPAHPSLSLILMALILGLLGGILAVKIEKPVIIVATSLVGAELAVWGVGYFAGDYPSGSQLENFRIRDDSGKWVYDIPKAWWGYLAGIVVLTFMGLFFQFKKSGRSTEKSNGTYTAA